MEEVKVPYHLRKVDREKFMANASRMTYAKLAKRYKTSTRSIGRMISALYYAPKRKGAYA